MDGNIFACEISEASQKRAVLNILSKVERAKSDSQIYIAQCLPKSKAFEEIIRQSVEVGAAGNAPEEAVLAGQLFAQCMAEVLQARSK